MEGVNLRKGDIVIDSLGVCLKLGNREYSILPMWRSG